MARVSVAIVAVVGVLLAGAGLFAALAWGLPALGLNRYGRNPVDETMRGLAGAATLYAVGAALAASATRWIRNHAKPETLRAFAPVGGVFVVLFVVLSIWMAVLGYWTNIPLLLFFMVGIVAPIALGGLPWGNQLGRRVRS
jgi:hypothetical protein